MKKGVLIPFDPRSPDQRLVVPPASEFDRVQDLLIDFRAQLLIPCESSEELESLLIATNKILSGLRTRIVNAFSERSISEAALRDLAAIFSLVWARARSLRSNDGPEQVRVQDIPRELVEGL